MKDDLFLQRVNVKIADLARSAEGLKSVKMPVDQLEMVNRARMALEGEDVSDDVVEGIERAFSARQVGPSLLRTFWDNYHVALSPIPGSRLLVNPPENVDPGSSGPVTARFQDWLTGHYGLSLKRFPTSIEMMNVKSENHGFFDDVTVFWDVGVPVKDLCGFVLPGCTVTLVRPNKTVHGRWMTVVGLDMSFSGIVEALESQFKLNPIVQSGLADVHSITLGIESK
jgi:hypothetical protein